MTGGDPAILLETDFGKVLQDPSIDIVDICLPPHLHVLGGAYGIRAPLEREPFAAHQ